LDGSQCKMLHLTENFSHGYQRSGRADPTERLFVVPEALKSPNEAITPPGKAANKPRYGLVAVTD
jgi:hypothetical protein